jgi:hypothetical protein
MMSDATCKTCPWWSAWPAADGNPKTGDCRRTPPHRTILDYDTGEDGGLATYGTPDGHDIPLPPTQIHLDGEPRTGHGYWCGSHPDRQPHLEGLSTTLVTRATAPTAADMRRLLDALEKMASRAARRATP